MVLTTRKMSTMRARKAPLFFLQPVATPNHPLKKRDIRNQLHIKILRPTQECLPTDAYPILQPTHEFLPHSPTHSRMPTHGCLHVSIREKEKHILRLPWLQQLRKTSNPTMCHETSFLSQLKLSLSSYHSLSMVR